MEQNFDINDIEIVLSKVLDDMELKQVIKLFKNYKKDEKILEKTKETEIDLSIDDIKIIGGREFRKFSAFDNGHMTNMMGIDSNNIYYLKVVNNLDENITFNFISRRARFNEPVKTISFEQFEKWVIENYSDIPRVKRYIESLNSKKYEETLPF